MMYYFYTVQGGDFATMLTFDVGEQKECVSLPIVVDAEVEMLLVRLELLGEPRDSIELSPSEATVVIVGEEIC